MSEPHELTTIPAFVILGSQLRADELSKANYGDITSTGRELSSGTTKDGPDEIAKWASNQTPQRIRDVHNHHQNSDKWDLYVPRSNDIIIDTSFKSGTTWMQTIVANLIFNGDIPTWNDPSTGVLDMSPWVDLRIPPPSVTADFINDQTHRRFLKSHLPLDALPYFAEVKYIIVARDCRDVAYSWYNHWYGARDFFENILNKIPGLIGSPVPSPVGWDAHKCFLDFADEVSDGRNVGLWSYWHHLATWLAYRHLPNILLVHYSNLKRDPRGEIARVAAFLDIDVSDELLDKIVHQTSIEYMKEHNEKIMGPNMASFFEGGGNTFINKGTNGRWQGEITESEIQKYMEYGKRRLGEIEMKWVLTGEWD